MSQTPLPRFIMQMPLPVATAISCLHRGAGGGGVEVRKPAPSPLPRWEFRLGQATGQTGRAGGEDGRGDTGLRRVVEPGVFQAAGAGDASSPAPAPGGRLGGKRWPFANPWYLSEVLKCSGVNVNF